MVVQGGKEEMVVAHGVLKVGGGCRQYQLGRETRIKPTVMWSNKVVVRGGFREGVGKIEKRTTTRRKRTSIES